MLPSIPGSIMSVNSFVLFSQTVAEVESADLKQYIMSCEDLGSFVLFMVDQESSDADGRISIRDTLKALIKATNQRSLFGKPKVVWWPHSVALCLLKKIQ